MRTGTNALNTAEWGKMCKYVQHMSDLIHIYPKQVTKTCRTYPHILTRPGVKFTFEFKHGEREKREIFLTKSQLKIT